MGQLRDPRSAAQLAEAMAIMAVDNRRAYDRPGEPPGSSQRLAEAIVQAYIKYRGGVEGLNLSVTVDQARKLSRTWLAQEVGEFYWDGTADIGGDHLIAVREIQAQRVANVQCGLELARDAVQDLVDGKASTHVAVRNIVAYPFPPKSKKQWDLVVADARMLRHERGEASAERAVLLAEAMGAKLQAGKDAGSKVFDIAQLFTEVRAEGHVVFGPDDELPALVLLAEHWIHGNEFRAAVSAREAIEGGLSASQVAGL